MGTTGVTTDGLRRSRSRAVTGAVLLGWLLCAAGCSQAPEETSAPHDDAVRTASAEPDVSRATPEEYRDGEKRFEALCARCHGLAGRGTKAGPPLTHTVYEPSHHSDMAFMRAATQGVRAHHWNFGDMPPVNEATPGDVAAIIAYVRWLQREAGIF